MPLNPFGKIRDRIQHDWRSIARPEQLPPPGDWNVWSVGRPWIWQITKWGSVYPIKG